MEIIIQITNRKLTFLQDILSGFIQITNTTGSDAKFDSIIVQLDGCVTLNLSNKTVGLFEAFTNSVKVCKTINFLTKQLYIHYHIQPISLLNNSTQLASGGKFATGTTQYKFEFPLTIVKEPKILFETYHGVFVAINYNVKCEIKRSFLAKSIQKSQQFVIQYKVNGKLI